MKAFLGKASHFIQTHRRTKSFIWSETQATHFGGPNGVFQGHGEQACSKTPSLNDSSSVSHASNRLANTLFQRMGVPILYTEEMTRSQWDAHVLHSYRRDFYVGKAVERIDCTHYCAPGVPDAIVPLLFNMLHFGLDSQLRGSGEGFLAL